MFRIVSYAGDKMSKNQYLSGNYEAAALAKTTLSQVCYKIGAQTFTGHHKEARLLYKEFEKELNLESLIIARFHLGISYTRTSDYELARQFFIDNLKLLKEKKVKTQTKWFIFQGLSFYRYFFSQHKKSQRSAEKAYAFLLKDTNPPPLLISLSLDIQGHNLIQLGKISQGLSLQKQAYKMTKKLKMFDWSSEIEISHLSYQSEFDSEVRQQIEKLKGLLKTTRNKNDHSRSELILQIAKLYLLSGQYQKANDFLAENFHFIYENENKRKIAKLNTLMAQLMFIRGQNIEALSLTRVAQKNLNEHTDFSLLLPILGLERKLLTNLNQDTTKIDLKINQLFSRMDRSLNHRIQNRLTGLKVDFHFGEDPLGDLMDGIYRKDHSALKVAIQKGVFGLLPTFFDIRPGQKAIVISEKLGQLISINGDEIKVHDAKLTKNHLLLLRSLSHQGISKESLINQLWGYEYDPLRHDSLIYSSMGRLRKVLEDRKNWISADESKYYLDPEVIIIYQPIKIHKDQVLTATLSDNLLPAQNVNHSGFNHRQLETLNDNSGKAMSVSEYGKKWSVTRMTALRDLKDLTDKGLMYKTGQGKATRYLVPSI